MGKYQFPTRLRDDPENGFSSAAPPLLQRSRSSKLRNKDELWIDPMSYQGELEAAVDTLTARGMNVSLYNLQLCVLRQSLWRFARKSISDWKNIFLPECQSCSKLEQCGG